MAGINRDGPAGTLAAMQEAARPPGGGHDHPHDHPDLGELIDNHADAINAAHDRLDDHDARLSRHVHAADGSVVPETDNDAAAIHGEAALPGGGA